MNKKILALIMALLVAVQCFGFTGFASEKNMTTAIQNEEFLIKLGIIEDNLDGSTTVTRGMAAYYVAQMLGNTYQSRTYKGVFSDVSASTEYALAIECLADLGIVRGDGSYRYRPDDNLTYYEAACIFAAVLGYGITGDVATRAYEYINRNGIFDGVMAQYDYVNIADLTMMIYNALHSNVLEQVTYGTKEEYKMSEDDILYKNFGILYTYGTVAKNDLTYLWTSQDADEDTLELDMGDDGILTVDISKEKPDTRDILGKYITLYYYPNANTKKIEYVHHNVENSDDIYTLNLTQINLNKSDLDLGVVYYYNENNDEKKISLSSDCALIYNNATYKSHTIDLSAFENKVGRVELIDYDNNGKYDVVKLKVYDTMIVGSVSSTYNQIFDKFSVSDVLDIDENEYTKIFVYDANGTAIAVEDIVPGDILSVAKSETYSGDAVLEILVSKTTVNGRITEYEQSSYEPKIVVDYTNEYTVTDRAAETLVYNVGAHIIGYNDVFGNLVYISDDYGRDMQYGLVIGTAYDTKGLQKEVKVKLRTLSGDVEIVNLAKSVTIDGVTYKESPDGAYNQLAAAKTVVDTVGTLEDIYVIRYKKDSDGMLKIIDTQLPGAGGDKDSLEMLIGGQYVVDGQNVIGREVACRSDATVLCISVSDFMDPSLYEEETSVYANNLTDAFRSNILYNCVAYRSDSESAYADFVVKLDTSSLYYDDTLFVVDLVKNSHNEHKDETMYKIEGISEGVKKTIWMDAAGANKQLNAAGDVKLTDELKNAVRGDIIRCVTDSTGRIVTYEYIYSRGGETDTLTRPINSTDFTPSKTTSLSMVNGYVYSREGELIKTNNLAFGTVPVAKDINFDSETLYTTVIPGSVTVVIVDDTEEKVFTGTVDDILDYERFSDNCSMIITKFRSEVLRELIVYNK